MSSKLAKSTVFKRKYKWGILRVALKKRRGRRKVLQSLKITESVFKSYKLVRKLNKTRVVGTRDANLKLKSSESFLPSSNNFLATYYRGSDFALLNIAKTFDLARLRYLSYIALNLDTKNFKLISSPNIIKESLATYKLVSGIRPLADYSAISSFTQAVKPIRASRQSNFINANARCLWAKAMTYNMKLRETVPYNSLASSDGYLPLFILKDNFSFLDKSSLSVRVPTPKSLFRKPISVRRAFRKLSSRISARKSLVREKTRMLSRVSFRRRRAAKIQQVPIIKKVSKPSPKYMKNIANILTSYQNSFYLERSRTGALADNSTALSFRTSQPLIGSADPFVFSKATVASFINLNQHFKVGGSSTSEISYPRITLASRTFRSFRPFLERSLAFNQDISPWVNDAVIRFIENCSGKRALFQLSSRIEGMVDNSSKLRYKLWIQRMSYYERNLGHRFFMEEALHIIHLSFRYHDVSLFSSWLKAIITRISFWKTRSIFRFLKYVFNNYYRFIFDDLSIKGLKIRLKGKISAAGNSRKRTILFRSGKGSHSQVKMKCLHDFKTITTFSGVLGFQVWLFY